MADQNAVITPGPPILITSGLAGGATVYNHDTQDAIWVGVTPDVSPGNGSKVGALGSVVWSQNGPIYAVVDTGVTTPVSVTLSTSTTNPVDPVAVGSAVAAQLLATGVPSVLTGAPVPYNNTGSIINVSNYAAITVGVLVMAPGKLTYQFTSDAAGFQITASRTLVVAVAGYIYFNAPVNGPYFQISATGGLNNLSIYGTNRTLVERVLVLSPGASKGLTQTWLANGSSQDLGLQITTNGGPHQLRMVVTGSGKGYCTASIWDEISGSINTVPIGHTGEGMPAPSGIAGVTELIKTVYLPPGIIKFGFISYLAASYQVIVAVIPPS
jgi:hypothetical protein